MQSSCGLHAHPPFTDNQTLAHGFSLSNPRGSFLVAQIFNLLFRRFSIGMAHKPFSPLVGRALRARRVMSVILFPLTSFQSQEMGTQSPMVGPSSGQPWVNMRINSLPRRGSGDLY